MTERNCKLCFHYSVCYAVGGIPERANTCSKCVRTTDVVPRAEVKELIYKMECFLSRLP